MWRALVGAHSSIALARPVWLAWTAVEDTEALEPAASGESKPKRAAIDRSATLDDVWGLLRPLERLNVRIVRASFRIGLVDRLIALLQRTIGRAWIEICTRALRSAYGLERLPELRGLDNILLVSNHRSFFDMFVLTMVLYQHG